MAKQTYTIDATNRPLGRLAVEVAIILRGKNNPAFALNKEADVFVNVKNVGKISLSGKKMKQKTYVHHTGYPGGLRKATMEEVVAKKGLAEVFRKAVWGMLPANKLRSKVIKRLIIE
ncbi:MAG: 50S ribosomal protein L13 [Patescibacteria group bacterium]|nr:50S ribosomal protein L13 [Patescibacteria group bacterium]